VRLSLAHNASDFPNPKSLLGQTTVTVLLELPAATRNIARIAADIVQKVGKIDAIRGHADATRGEPSQKSLPSLINGRNVTETELYWMAILQRFLAAPLERFDAFSGEFTVKSETGSPVTKLFI
jgi:hypothetical protein